MDTENGTRREGQGRRMGQEERDKRGIMNHMGEGRDKKDGTIRGGWEWEKDGTRGEGWEWEKDGTRREGWEWEKDGERDGSGRRRGQEGG